MGSMVEQFAGMFCKAYLQADKLEIETATRQLVSAVNYSKERKKYKRIRDRARNFYASQGYIEIDDDAIISLSESDPDGAYVAAWVWVDIEEFSAKRRQ